jgi:FMN-dependent NADH-azoreductase|tara:strand:- start:1435 stop:1686 length:252 start_codon:yes stop_codon:yes gene_type:complete
MAQKDKERAFKAKQVLENDVYREAVASLENQLIEAWQQTSVSQHEERERLYLMLLATRRVVSHLENIMVTGRMAEMQELTRNG